MTATVNIEAEASVLGTVLVDGTLFNELATKAGTFRRRKPPYYYSGDGGHYCKWGFYRYRHRDNRIRGRYRASWRYNLFVSYGRIHRKYGQLETA